MPLFFLLFAIALALPVVWPGVDLIASGWFYRAGQGFYLADNPIFVTLHWLAYDGARALGVAFAVLAVVATLKRTTVVGIDAKAWLFLLFSLVVGPALIANAGFKDHWGRARPREVVEFGGAASFSPALVPQANERPNESFVSGDGAFGFFLPAFAFVAAPRRSRRVFWGGMGLGALFGFARLVMGAHFLSDIIYAAALMLGSTSVVHAVMYGRKQTAARWRGFFKRQPIA